MLTPEQTVRFELVKNLLASYPQMMTGQVIEDAKKLTDWIFDQKAGEGGLKAGIAFPQASRGAADSIEADSAELKASPMKAGVHPVELPGRGYGWPLTGEPGAIAHGSEVAG
jgi:hypothetical protein